VNSLIRSYVIGEDTSRDGPVPDAFDLFKCAARGNDGGNGHNEGRMQPEKQTRRHLANDGTDKSGRVRARLPMSRHRGPSAIRDC